MVPAQRRADMCQAGTALAVQSHQPRRDGGLDDPGRHVGVEPQLLRQLDGITRIPAEGICQPGPDQHARDLRPLQPKH